MLFAATILVFLSVTLLIGAVGARFVLAPRRAVIDRLRSVRGSQGARPASPELQGPRRTSWRQRLFPGKKQNRKKDLTVVGLKPNTSTACVLLYAGFRSHTALRTLLVARMSCALAFGSLPLLISMYKQMAPELTFLLMAGLGLTGFVLPKILVRMKARRRQLKLRLSLPDALDLLVVCVEAGMGLNQAIIRVSDELSETHAEIADEFRLVNLEIAAGRTRSEALRALGERTGVEDVISLAAMIIQTDRFGTSIARSLRVHSDSLRIERRQRAEEAAAKTTIKLIFPLMFCIFPALFVVVLGPAAFHLWRVFGAAG